MSGKLITQVIGEIRGGVFVNNASKELSELVERCQLSGLKGKITVELEITPSGTGNRIMTVTPKLTVKKPPMPETQDAATFFAVRGDLVRDDPDQKTLGLRAVNETESDAGTVGQRRADGPISAVGVSKGF